MTHQLKSTSCAVVLTHGIDRARQWAWVAVLSLALLLPALSAHARSAPESFADLAEKLLPTVVNISTTQIIEGRGQEMPQVPRGSPFEDFFKEFFDRQQQGQPQKRRATSLGSGFIIDAKNGYIVTNNHVIQDADEVAVILHDDTRFEAEVVGRDPKSDVAVLKIAPGDYKLPTVKWGDSDKARVGDWVVAIGNPFGLGGTVTAGIVSARGRNINAGPYDDFIQTDASINRGNSGGPLFNLDGEVVGINTAIFSPSGGSVGIGFAIPVTTAKSVVDQLIKHGKVRRGWLGVHIQEVTPELAETLELKEPSGALVANVIDGSPAESGGIKAGDVILKFGGRDITEMRKLPRIVAETEVGEAAKVEVWREGETLTLSIEVGALEEGEKQLAATEGGASKSDAEEKIDSLGLTVAPVNDQTRERFGLEEDAKGVVVTEVDGEGNAAAKGVQAGDVIVEVSQEEVGSPKELTQKVEKAKDDGKKSVLLLLKGQGGLRFVAIKLAKT